MGLGGLDFGSALAVVENVEGSFGFEAAHANMDQEASEATHHFVEESISLNLDHYISAVLADIE